MTAYTDTITLIPENNYFNLKLDIAADLSFGSYYRGGLYEGKERRSYGIKADAISLVYLQMEFFKWYQQNLYWNYLLFDVRPYT